MNPLPTPFVCLIRYVFSVTYEEEELNSFFTTSVPPELTDGAIGEYANVTLSKTFPYNRR